MNKQNWFETLNAALESEDLVSSWTSTGSMSYGEALRYTFEDGSRNGRQVCLYRSDSGLYERPVHYPR